MKLAIIGGKTSTVGFKALGLDTFTVRRPVEAPEVWKRMDPAQYAVVLVTEPVYRVLKEEIGALDRESLPVITVIPAVTGSAGVGERELRELVERAVGTDVMFRE